MGEPNKTSGFSDSEQLDLNLGLSLGGFYSEKIPKKPLIRTSSLNLELGALSEYEEGGGLFLSVARSASLPTEAEQELRRVREMQAVKRVEAKRRLLEKQRLSRGGSGGGGGGFEVVVKSLAAAAAGEGRLPSWAVESATKNAAFCRAVEKLRANVGQSANLMAQGPENSTAAAVSQPTITSSRATENGKSPAPTNFHLVNFGSTTNGKKSRYPTTLGIRLEKTENGKPVDSANSYRRDSTEESPFKKGKVLAEGSSREGSSRDMAMMEIMRLMPSVTTTGDGPNGKKIEGFLYRYTKGRVSIVCVCHGKFLSPAEFVKHAGGGDVANPMKHINVLPAAL